eukprot:TRINITY_DN9562_c0_g1_i2.p1 TRINITY_DN9562_c0_g1~~TRINITY_DN9562_c0_g1_i2.p1  ORF type:complete len:114 (+),score=11.44 TRINITY_DN9562_c0_g1_i2:78-419(+)
MDEAFDYLDAPLQRLTAADVPMPYSLPLEKATIPQPFNVVNAALRVLHRKKQLQPFHLSLIHISEPTRPLYISYAVFCLKKKKKTTNIQIKKPQTSTTKQSQQKQLQQHSIIH